MVELTPLGRHSKNGDTDILSDDLYFADHLPKHAVTSTRLINSKLEPINDDDRVVEFEEE